MIKYKYKLVLIMLILILDKMLKKEKLIFLLIAFSI